MIVGTLLVLAGGAGLVHPQWQGRENKMSVNVGSKEVEVATRRITDVPPLFSWAVIVAGGCTALLGAISRPKP
jgi:hypothetical protein